jgi:outer membrane protein OmpA-like peptidoglycan-associated protein
LDQLTKILQQNPGIRIELGSHTDCRGNDGYNLNLSQQRAQAAVDYLIGNGIAPDRLSARGYGETQPAVVCDCNRCTEAEHQSNRRTTFKILE